MEPEDALRPLARAVLAQARVLGQGISSYAVTLLQFTPQRTVEAVGRDGEQAPPPKQRKAGADAARRQKRRQARGAWRGRRERPEHAEPRPAPEGWEVERPRHGEPLHHQPAGERVDEGPTLPVGERCEAVAEAWAEQPEPGYLGAAGEGDPDLLGWAAAGSGAAFGGGHATIPFSLSGHSSRSSASRQILWAVRSAGWRGSGGTWRSPKILRIRTCSRSIRLCR